MPFQKRVGGSQKDRSGAVGNGDEHAGTASMTILSYVNPAKIEHEHEQEGEASSSSKEDFDICKKQILLGSFEVNRWQKGCFFLGMFPGVYWNFLRCVYRYIVIYVE